MSRDHRVRRVLLVLTEWTVWTVFVAPLVRQALRDYRDHREQRVLREWMERTAPPARLDAMVWTVHRDRRGNPVRRDLPVRRVT